MVLLSTISDLMKKISNGQLDGASDGILTMMFIVGCLLVVASIFAFIVSIVLAISYHKYNKKQNSLGKTGEEIAREILDNNDLQNIKVSKNGSILFGNSYSHFFKKVRLRRLTWKKTSVTSLAMAAQKSSLAVLDKEKDPDMRLKNILTPFIYLGPLAFVPFVLVGVVLDMLVFTFDVPVCTIVCTVVGFLFYIASFIMSIVVLRTEKKAQQKALKIIAEEHLATEQEIEDCKHLFKLYNIEYINDMIIALLELVYRVLQLIGYAQSSSSFSSSKD